MRIVVGQINPVVGDIKGNTRRICEILQEWSDSDPDLYVFPELCITGYPPRDLLERTWLIRDTGRAVEELKSKTRDMDAGVIIGAPVPTGRTIGKGLYNTALLLHRGSILHQQNKRLLPAYDVFDEERYFDPGTSHSIVDFKGEKLGLTICEDAWNDPTLWRRRMYTCDPMDDLARQGATFLVNISASPYHVGKEKIRRRLMLNHAEKHALPVLFVNQTGGNDALIFDGRSMLIKAPGDMLIELPAFESKSVLVDTSAARAETTWTVKGCFGDDQAKNMHDALVLGIRDYIWKCGFKNVLVGLSGGIDSAVTAALAVHALGAENVTGVTMPGPFSSEGSVTDSLKLAHNLNIICHTLGITGIYESFLKTLEPHFRNTPFGTAEENIQARIRGNLLMALSNKNGAIVLTTGNKSEIAVGYCTLYGDMSGGLSVLSDVPKTWVYRLAEYINRETDIIPVESIVKPPSAELRQNQKDQDTLPPYDILDAILELYIDDGLSCDEITGRGFDSETVRWIIRTVDRNEYKRLQAAPGLKVTSKAFGAGRRMPVAARGQIC